MTSLRIGAPHGTELRAWLEREAEVTLGIGLGMAEPGDPAWHGFFRMGHMGHVNAHMVLGMLGSVNAGLDALGIPHGQAPWMLLPRYWQQRKNHRRRDSQTISRSNP